MRAEANLSARFSWFGTKQRPFISHSSRSPFQRVFFSFAMPFCSRLFGRFSSQVSILVAMLLCRWTISKLDICHLDRCRTEWNTVSCICLLFVIFIPFLNEFLATFWMSYIYSMRGFFVIKCKLKCSIRQLYDNELVAMAHAIETAIVI